MSITPLPVGGQPTWIPDLHRLLAESGPLPLTALAARLEAETRS